MTINSLKLCFPEWEEITFFIDRKKIMKTTAEDKKGRWKTQIEAKSFAAEAKFMSSEH